MVSSTRPVRQSASSKSWQQGYKHDSLQAGKAQPKPLVLPGLAARLWNDLQQLLGLSDLSLHLFTKISDYSGQGIIAQPDLGTLSVLQPPVHLLHYQA